MRVLEAKATKEVERKLSRRLVLEGEEGQLMEERKKRKEDKRKKDAALKKTAEQKNKGAEPAKPGARQPLPTAPAASPPTADGSAGGSHNARRGAGHPPQQQQPQQQPQQQQPQQPLPRYPPREVPPRFRHHEQKQLLKRGQPLPGIAATLGPASKPLNGPAGGRSSGASEPPAAAGEEQSSSPKQAGPNLSPLGSHDEGSRWGGAAPSTGDAGPPWDPLTVEGSGKEATATASDSERGSACADADSTPSAERAHRTAGTMASRATGGEAHGLRNGLGPPAKLAGGGSSSSSSNNNNNNVGKGSHSRPWGVALGAAPSPGPVSAEAPKGTAENGGGGGRKEADGWAACGVTNGDASPPSPLSSNGHHRAWPLAESHGPALKGGGGGGPPANPRGMSATLGGSWSGLQGNGGAHPNGTRKGPRGGQPPHPDVSGPNHHSTTNFAASSLPNPAGSGQQTNEPAGSTAGPGAWGGRDGSGQPAPQASLGLNGEAKNGGAAGPAWGGSYSPCCARDPGPDPSGRATGDTVHAPQRPLGFPAAGSSASDPDRGLGAASWEVSGLGGLQNPPWERGPGQRGPAQGANAADGEWNKAPPKQAPCEDPGGSSKKLAGLWKAVAEEKPGVEAAPHNGPASRDAEQNGRRAREGEGRQEAPEEKGPAEGPERQKADPQALLQSIVSRADLDPRVLSNSGWGQTPIKQNTAWDTAMSPRGGRKADNGTEAWGGQPSTSTSRGVAAERHGPTSNTGWADPKPATRWGDSRGPGPQGGWEEGGPGPTPLAKGSQQWGSGQESRGPCPAWSEAEKPKQQGWTEVPKAGPGWAAAPVEGWGENPRSNHWGEPRKASSGSSDSDRSSGHGWKEPVKPSPAHWTGGSAKSGPASGWQEPAKPSQGHGWGEPPKAGRSQSWGEAPPPKRHPSPDWGKPPEVGCWGAPPATGKPPGAGWRGGPVPALGKEEESTGWEEPSPESVRRKAEIDDGTAAWGDPSKYNGKAVNMWNRNAPPGGSQPDQQQPAQKQQQQPPPQGCSTGAAPEGGGGGSGSHGSSSSSGWGDPPAGPGPADNGTSAWGKPVDPGPSWGEAVGDATGSSSRPWGNATLGRPASSKPGPASMQVPDGWCGGNMPLAGNQQPSWEEEEDVEIGMWNSHAMQEANGSMHWAPGSKRPPAPKGTMKNGNKQDDMWMNPFAKQFANLGFPRESPEEMMQSNKMDIPGGLLPDKWVEMEQQQQQQQQHNLNAGEYSRAIGKALNPRPPAAKESSLDRCPYFEKEGLLVADESPPVPFLPNPKFPPSNGVLPNPALSSLPGLSMPSLSSARQNGNPPALGNLAAQSRGLQLPPAQPLSASQPNPRAQVPPPLLSPQVPVSLLKYAPNSGGLSPLFGPQQVAMLSQLSQLNQLSQLQRLLAQQRKLQSQRSLPVGGRQQQEQQQQQQQQQSRSFNMHQPQHQPQPPMMSQSCQLDPTQLLKQQLHSSTMKSFLENANAELPKGPSQINAFSNFPVGVNSTLNVNMEVGSMKEPQSRLRKWTTVDSISANTSLDHNASKNGAVSGGFRLEEAPFVPYDFMDSSGSPASPPGPIGDGWPRAKSPSGSSSVNWPPEFRPGEPWKGYPNIDPEADPYITPGSVTNNLSIHTVREADHLRDRNSGSCSSLNNTALPSTSAWSSIRASNYSASLSSSSSTAQSTSTARNSEAKSAWMPASLHNTSLAHELWKVPLAPKSVSAPSRPPPGLTGQKVPLSPWESSGRLGGGWSHSEARYTPGSSWGESSSGRITNCLVLKNLTPQIDGSTLRTLCMQHGPLITFHLNLPHGNALVRYSSKEEVIKAQKSLHMCVLGNTTILAELASEEEVSRFFAQGPSVAPSPAWQSLGTGQNRLGSLEGGHAYSHRSDPNNHWSGTGLSGTTGSADLHGSASSLWGSPGYSSSLWGSLGGPSPLNAFLSADHLGTAAGE